ncbi:MAG TPA: ion transporter [Pseudonocardiaceae bacterium]
MTVGHGAVRRPAVGVAVSPVDWVMLVLAVVAVGLLGWVTFGRVSDVVAWRVFVADTVLCGVFALEFGWRWWRDGWDRAFPRRHWYELIGMIPVAHPALHGYQALRTVVLVARVGAAADRAFGARFSARLISRVVDVIKRPVTVAVLDEVVDVLQAGHYSRNVATALREHHEELRAMVLEKIKQDARAGRLSVLPFHDEIVRAVADATLRVLHDVLMDPRTDELVASMLRENVEQIRMAVHGRYRPLEPSDWPMPGAAGSPGDAGGAR